MKRCMILSASRRQKLQHQRLLRIARTWRVEIFRSDLGGTSNPNRKDAAIRSMYSIDPPFLRRELKCPSTDPYERATLHAKSKGRGRP